MRDVRTIEGPLQSMVEAYLNTRAWDICDIRKSVQGFDIYELKRQLILPQRMQHAAGTRDERPV